MFYDRNPESMRTVPRVFGGGRDPIPREALEAVEAVHLSQNASVFRKISGARNTLKIKAWRALAASESLNFEKFGFFGFSTSPNMRPFSARKPSFFFLFWHPSASLAGLGPGRPGGPGPGAAAGFGRPTQPRLEPSQFLYIHLLPINRLCGRYVIIKPQY